MLRNFLLVVLTVISFPSLAQEDMGKKGNASVNEVTNKIYLYRNRGGNILIAEGKEEVLLVDSQFDDIAEELLDEIKKIAGEKQVRFLINTHHHQDHTGGNARLTEDGAIVVAHENTYKRLSEFIQEARNNRKKIDQGLLPQITFGEDMTLHFDQNEVLIKALPGGHTDSDAVVFFKRSNVIHTGDAFLNSRYPFFDTESGGSVEGYLESLNVILDLIDDNTKVIPGHGEVGSKRDVIYLKNMLNQVYKRVRLEHLKKKSLEEILAMTDITAKFDEEGFGDGYIGRDKFIESLVNNLRQEYDFEEIERQKERFKEAQQKANLLDSKFKGGGKQ